MTLDKPRLLINLPPTFFTVPQLQPHLERLEQLAGEVRKTSHNTTDEILPDLRWAEAVILWAWPAFGAGELLNCPALRFVGQLNTTQKHVLGCLEGGIAISEVRHCWSPAVAEMALALMLNGLRKVSDYHAAMRLGQEAWVNDFPQDIDPLERQLTGRQVGIVGFGKIGQRLAELLEPFHVTLRIYDPFLPEAVRQQFKGNVRQVASVLELARQSEIVVLCAANNEGARRLIDAQVIQALRQDAILVNVGRSMLVDMPVLIERLQQGGLIALLDVFDQEPLESDHPLRKLPNAYLTPHRAGGLLVSVERALTMLADDLEAFLAGRERKYAVTPGMLASLPEG